MTINIKSQDKIFINNYSKPMKIFERIDFIKRISKNRRVLHFGFLDAPFLRKKIESNGLLHENLKPITKYLYGVDISQETLKSYRIITHDINNSIYDISAKKISKKFLEICKNDYEIILFTEILEHVQNCGIALSNIIEIMRVNPKSKLVITVPNAFSYGGNEYARSGYEIVHPEHYYYFSPTTLKKLLKDVGFKRIQISLIDNNSGALMGISASGVIAVASI